MTDEKLKTSNTVWINFSINTYRKRRQEDNKLIFSS